MTTRKLYQQIASTIDAYHRCVKTHREKIWELKHLEALHAIEANYLPHGSGIDNGCQFDLDHSTAERIMITSSYHCMDENGMYDGWADFAVTVTPSLVFGVSISVKSANGCSRQFVKYDLGEYLTDVFRDALEWGIGDQQLAREAE